MDSRLNNVALVLAAVGACTAAFFSFQSNQIAERVAAQSRAVAERQLEATFIELSFQAAVRVNAIVTDPNTPSRCIELINLLIDADSSIGTLLFEPSKIPDLNMFRSRVVYEPMSRAWESCIRTASLNEEERVHYQRAKIDDELIIDRLMGRIILINAGPMINARVQASLTVDAARRAMEPQIDQDIVCAWFPPDSHYMKLAERFSARNDFAAAVRLGC